MHNFRGIVYNGDESNDQRRFTRDTWTNNRVKNIPAIQPRLHGRPYLDTTTHVQARWMLNALTDVASWAWMKFKAIKSRSLVMMKGKVTDRLVLRMQNEDISSTLNDPINCLGKWFDAILHGMKKTDNKITVLASIKHGFTSMLSFQGLPGHDAARRPKFYSRSPWKNYQSSLPEMARNTTKLLQCRIVWKEQQASTPTLLTGGRVQENPLGIVSDSY